MAPHSSTLAWKIPWMEDPGVLQSMESQRVGAAERLHYAVKCILTSPTLHLDLKNFPDSLVSPRPSLAGIYYVINKCLPPCFPVGLVVKNPPFNARDTGSIPGWGRSAGGGNGNLLQYCCLEIPMERGAWGATVHRITKSRK